jgi:FKBP-type peptidyl-prolyl cis-trans isomerase
MKRFIAVLLCVPGFFVPVFGEGIADDMVRVSALADTSYAMGMVIGSDLKQTGMRINYSAFARGLRDALEDRETGISMDEAILRIQTAYNAVMLERTEENKEKERLFLEENGRREGVYTTASGLQYEIISLPEGPRPGPSSLVRVNYEGSLLDGTVFDSSYDRGEPAEFQLDRVIPGWSEGLQLMTPGSACRLYIPSELAYGEQGAGMDIPPSSLLIFDVELVEILSPPALEEPGPPALP